MNFYRTPSSNPAVLTERIKFLLPSTPTPEKSNLKKLKLNVGVCVCTQCIKFLSCSAVLQSLSKATTQAEFKPYTWVTPLAHEDKMRTWSIKHYGVSQVAKSWETPNVSRMFSAFYIKGLGGLPPNQGSELREQVHTAIFGRGLSSHSVPTEPCCFP
jgi:hypothetical protein